MKIAYFDCFSGISGDMAVGALLDAGVPLPVVEEALRLFGLQPGEVEVSVRSITRSQIHATKFDVTLGSPVGKLVGDDVPAVHLHEHEHLHEHAHEHDHAHEHGHAHEHAHEHGHAHEHVHEDLHDHSHAHTHDHSSYREIVAMIERSSLADRVKDWSCAIFRAIGIAEARIHNSTLEDIHFHEVGALDSIADIIAVAACLDHLNVEEVYSSPVPLGSGGMITTQHGIMPLPAPATLEILKGYPVEFTSVPFELTTPTGAAIVKALSRGTISTEQLQVDRVGFGAGTRDLPDRPNLLRVVIGELVADEERDVITLIESNIDDMNPQVFPYLMERLLESGALDVYVTPVIMKKGRPGMVLSALAPRGAIDELTKVIYRETTTIGVRYSEMTRRKLRREEIMVPTEWGTVRMKKIVTPDGLRVAPEYEEARRIARERGLPLHDVMDRLDEVARRVAEDVLDRGE